MKKLLLVTFILGILACNKEIGSKLEKDEMINLIADLYVAENAVIRASESIKDSLQNLYTEQILEIYSLDKDELKEVISQLKNDPENLIELLEETQSNLKELKERFKKEKDN